MRKSSLGKVAVATLGLALTGIGCEGMMGGGKEGGGKVVDRQQSQDVNPDGSAVRTREQTRQTPSGATVRETETQKREVVTPAPGGQGTDATKSDPGQ